MPFASEHALDTIARLEQVGVGRGPPMPWDALERAEAAFGCRFPPELGELLRTAIPLGDGWIDWRREPEAIAEEADAHIVRAFEFDISKDQIVPFPDQQDIFAQAGSPSGVFEIIGGNHSQYTDSGQLLAFDGVPTIPLATQQAICRRYVTAWFGYLLKNQTGPLAPYAPGGAVFQSDTRLQNRAWK